MSTTGSAESYVELRGSLSIPDAIHGKSAYEIAVMHGFEGTEQEWLDSLRYGTTIMKITESAVDGGNNVVTFSDGKTLTVKNGTKGATGTQGIQGKQGVKGDKGDKGDPGTGVSVKANAAACTEIGDAYIDSNGNLMILTTLPSTFTNGGQIKGPQGEEGDSAYQVAVNNGFEGTEEEWLDSLNGKATLNENELTTLLYDIMPII